MGWNCAVMGSIVVSASILVGCSSSAPSARAPTPAGVQAVATALNARLDACRVRGNATACMTAASPLRGEPSVCAEYQMAQSSPSIGGGATKVGSPGSWRLVPTWRLLGDALLAELPTIGEHERRALPLSAAIPADIEAPMPFRGHFLPVFAPLGAGVAEASEDELRAVQADSATFADAVNARLAAGRDPRRSWAMYSKPCFDELARGAEVLKSDLASATSRVRSIRERKDVAAWLDSAKDQCANAASDALCRTAPAFATERDRNACSKPCSEMLSSAAEKAFSAAVKTCSESYVQSQGQSSPSCTFALPTDSSVRLDDRTAECATACEAAAKREIAAGEERSRAKKEGAYLVFAFRHCMRDALKSPEAEKSKAANAERYTAIVQREDKKCRYLSKCDWLEQYSERQCKAP